MIRWIINKFKCKPSLEECFWDSQPSLIRMEVGRYDDLCLGWIYSGLFDQDRHFSIRVLNPNLSHVDWKKEQVIGKGWYRYQLGIL